MEFKVNFKEIKLMFLFNFHHKVPFLVKIVR